MTSQQSVLQENDKENTQAKPGKACSTRSALRKIKARDSPRSASARAITAEPATNTAKRQRSVSWAQHTTVVVLPTDASAALPVESDVAAPLQADADAALQTRTPALPAVRANNAALVPAAASALASPLTGLPNPALSSELKPVVSTCAPGVRACAYKDPCSLWALQPVSRYVPDGFELVAGAALTRADVPVLPEIFRLYVELELRCERELATAASERGCAGVAPRRERAFVTARMQQQQTYVGQRVDDGADEAGRSRFDVANARAPWRQMRARMLGCVDALYHDL